MKAMHVTTTTTTTYLHTQYGIAEKDAKPQCKLLVLRIVVNISYNHHTYVNNNSNQLSRKYKRRAEYIKYGIHRTTHTMNVIHDNKYE